MGVMLTVLRGAGWQDEAECPAGVPAAAHAPAAAAAAAAAGCGGALAEAQRGPLLLRSDAQQPLTSITTRVAAGRRSSQHGSG